MEGNMALMSKILENLRTKYNQYNNLYNLTKQLEEVIKLNDHYALDSVLEMREKVMMVVDQLDMDNNKIIDQLQPHYEMKVRSILTPKKGATLKLDNPLETDLFDTNKRNIALLNRTVTLDKKLSELMNKRPPKSIEIRG